MERQAVTKVQKTPAGANHLRTQSAQSSLAANPLLELQRSIGNQAIQRLISSPSIQTKLQVSTPGDPYEQEADRIADTVMRMPEPEATQEKAQRIQAKPLATRITPLVQRAPEPGEEDEEESVAGKPILQRALPLAVREDDDEEKVAPKLIQRMCTECEEEKQQGEGKSGGMVQRKSALEQLPDDDQVQRQSVQLKAGQTQAPQVTPSVAANIHSLNGGGSPLPNTTRAFFEPRFGADFSQVRVHTDSRAAETANSIQARAFTVGQNIAFATGQYSPESREGRQVLAHELTHVLQQNGSQLQRAQPRATGQVVGLIQRQSEDPGPCAERVETPRMYGPPNPRGEIFYFNNQPLSRDEDFCLSTLEWLQETDPYAPGRFVEQFKIARRQKAESLEGEKNFRRQVEESPIPPAGGVPLPDDMLQTLETEVQNLTEIEPVLDGAARRLSEANAEFIREFDRASLDMTLCVLEISEQRTNQERERYGITEQEISETYIQEISERQWRRKTRTRTEYHMADNPESQKLIVAARALSMTQEKIRQLQTAQRGLMRTRFRKWGKEYLDIEYLPEENRAEFERLAPRIETAQKDYKVLRASLEGEHPLLAAMSDPNNIDAQRRLARVGQGVGGQVAGEQIAEVLGNIKESRKNLRSGDLKPWKLPRIVGATKLRMHVKPGSARDRLIDELIEARHDDESKWQILKAVVTIGLAIIAAIPTGGLSLAGAAVVVGAGVATVAIGAYTVVQDLREYDMMKAAHASDLDQARAISAEEPSLFWVALSIIGLGLDLGTAAQAFKGLVSTARNVATAGRAVEQLEPALTALRTEGNAVKNGLGDTLVEDALRMRGAKEEAEQALKGVRTAEAVAEGVGPRVKDSIDYLHHAICGLCFAEGTLVVTATGRRPIETLRVGDLVLARHQADPERVGYRRVLKTFANATDRFIEVGAGGQVIRSTPGHVWWCEDKGWTFAEELEIGDHVRTENGSLAPVTSLVVVDEVALGYNIAVEEFQTYYVAADEQCPAIWVHNESVIRILAPEQTFQLLIPNIVITNRSQIRAVVGAALSPKGSYQTEIGGLLQHMKKGEAAGFHSFTKEALTHFDVFLTNLAEKGGEGVVAAVDLARVGNVPVYDLGNPAILNKVLGKYPRFTDAFTELASEGVVSVGGKVPARAVQGMVHIPPGISDAERKALLTTLLKACER